MSQTKSLLKSDIPTNKLVGIRTWKGTVFLAWGERGD